VDLVDPADLPELPATGGAPAAAGFETPWQEWVQAYEMLPADLITRHHYLRKQAEIWEIGAHNNDLALATLERAFVLQTGDESVRAEMERLAREGDRWDQVCEIYLREAEREAREAAVALHLRVGQIREELGQIALAEERYRKVVVLETDNPIAVARLEQLYRTQERWADLAQVLERRITVPGGRLEGTEARGRAWSGPTRQWTRSSATWPAPRRRIADWRLATRALPRWPSRRVPPMRRWRVCMVEWAWHRRRPRHCSASWS
jgi:tetratricopeptide (TPR) repeat protein